MCILIHLLMATRLPLPFAYGEYCCYEHISKYFFDPYFELYSQTLDLQMIP